MPVALLIGWALTHSMDTSDFKGMGAGIAIMGIMLLTVIIAVVGSLVLVIASWWRRGRFRWAARRMKADGSPMRRRTA